MKNLALNSSVAGGNTMNRIVNSIEAKDIENHFHPYTNPQTLRETGPHVICRGEGIYVYDVICYFHIVSYFLKNLLTNLLYRYYELKVLY